ncbi:acyl-CoA dehydrogenase family protein [Myxococcus qinghaiensis]|uniref:acyl-CoA dehydrogenase family protein n=1 Tax=Myxococcus qinghaiensis TaxID=2906758 RepID=UPI0020A765D8|nr:acyl-CoA dehydrogenase family protein [Myxococcus qinghaiensis]MCP3165528.1 acyl-CoA dehydrogenase family protein [Myxococcus qinghaiensis]
MDFAWTPDERRMKAAAIAFGRERLAFDVVSLDAQATFNREGWHRLASFGATGFPIPRRYGGAEHPVPITAQALEGLGYGCADNGLLFALGAHLWACALPILLFGTEAQKERYLPALACGELLGGHAMTEPEAGSDVAALQTTATRKGAAYVLQGRKVFVTNGPVADLLLIFATVDTSRGREGLTAFLVEKGQPGLHVERTVPKMGLRTASMGELRLDDCEVPATHRLGEEGGGLPLFSQMMEYERGLILAPALGAMERTLERCIRRARERQQFGKPIGGFQAISHKLVEMKLRLETARGLLYRFAWLKQQGRSAMFEASLVKLHVSESWVQTSLDAVQLHGGLGYLTETELEREVRDALGSRIFSGTSELQRELVARSMGL